MSPHRSRAQLDTTWVALVCDELQLRLLSARQGMVHPTRSRGICIDTRMKSGHCPGIAKQPNCGLRHSIYFVLKIFECLVCCMYYLQSCLLVHLPYCTRCALFFYSSYFCVVLLFCPFGSQNIFSVRFNFTMLYLVSWA